MKVRFIINPEAGAGRAGAVTDAVREVLSSESGLFEVKVAEGKGRASGLSREAVERGYGAIFACGGDGTVNEVASALVGTSTVLGVVPMGSGNGFARALNLPAEGKEAVGLLKNLKVREIDVGVICGRYFFSTAGFGFDALLSKIYNESALIGRVRGMLPYYWLAVWKFFSYRPEPVTIRTDSGALTLPAFLITAANTDRYGGGALIAPGALPDDGLLDLCVIPEISVIGAAGLGIRLFSGDIDKFEGFTRIRTSRADIITRDKGVSMVHADGEPFECAGDISISVLPKKLKVLVK